MFYPTFVYHLLFIMTILLSVITIDFQKESAKKVLFIFIIFLILIGGLRGDFTTDYSHYVYHIELLRKYSFLEVFSMRGEKGFMLLKFLFSRLFESPVPFFITCMSIVLIPIYYFACKCKNPFLFLLLYISFGVMYQSYNVMRFIMMSSLFLCSFEWIKKGCFRKYLLYVLFLSCIHITALFLIPFYFLLRLEIEKKSFVIHAVIIFSLYFLLDPIMDYFDVLFYNGKFATRAIEQTGQTTITTIIVPFLFAIATFFMAFFSKKGDSLFDTKNKIFFNSTIYWISAFIISQKIAILGRFSSVFFPIVAMWFVNTLLSYSKELRPVYVWLTICFCVLYYFAFGQYYNQFYFFWQDSFIWGLK